MESLKGKLSFQEDSFDQIYKLPELFELESVLHNLNFFFT